MNAHRKATWKLGLMVAEARDVMASASSMSEAARRLHVDRATIKRWVRSGQIPALACRRGPPLASAAVVAPLVPDENRREPVTPEQWAEDIRRRYALDATEEQLLKLATAALTLALDPSATPTTALAAAGRYQQLIRQLNLEDAHGETTPARTWPRR
jgi:Helix-turn-helix domain